MNSRPSSPDGLDEFPVEQAERSRSGLPAFVLSIAAVAISLIVGLLVTSMLIIEADLTADDAKTGITSSPDEVVAEDNGTTDSEDRDLFAAPADLGHLIERVRASTVTILCRDSQGSGWVIDLGDVVDPDEESAALDEQYPNEVITNHHVIEDCVDTPRKVRAQTGPEEFDAYLYSWDEENDLALVAITQDVPYLEISEKPEPGWWAMAVGTPYGLEGSISIGNVMNLDGSEVYSTSPLNSGNSGGPMVNSAGQVMGTSTATLIGEDDPQDWNIAVGVPALCDSIVFCEPDSDDNWLWE